jgi:hypothetical protein
LIIKINENIQLIFKPSWVLSHTPSFSDKAIHIRPPNGTGMIHKIKADRFMETPEASSLRNGKFIRLFF